MDTEEIDATVELLAEKAIETEKEARRLRKERIDNAIDKLEDGHIGDEVWNE